MPNINNGINNNVFHIKNGIINGIYGYSSIDYITNYYMLMMHPFLGDV